MRLLVSGVCVWLLLTSIAEGPERKQPEACCKIEELVPYFLGGSGAPIFIVRVHNTTNEPVAMEYILRHLVLSIDGSVSTNHGTAALLHVIPGQVEAGRSRELTIDLENFSYPPSLPLRDGRHEIQVRLGISASPKMHFEWKRAAVH
jgi:hypothetical protein